MGSVDEVGASRMVARSVGLPTSPGIVISRLNFCDDDLLVERGTHKLRKVFTLVAHLVNPINLVQGFLSDSYSVSEDGITNMAKTNSQRPILFAAVQEEGVDDHEFDEDSIHCENLERELARYDSNKGKVHRQAVIAKTAYSFQAGVALLCSVLLSLPDIVAEFEIGDYAKLVSQTLWDEICGRIPANVSRKVESLTSKSSPEPIKMANAHLARCSTGVVNHSLTTSDLKTASAIIKAQAKSVLPHKYFSHKDKKILRAARAIVKSGEVRTSKAAVSLSDACHDRNRVYSDMKRLILYSNKILKVFCTVLSHPEQFLMSMKVPPIPPLVVFLKQMMLIAVNDHVKSNPALRSALRRFDPFSLPPMSRELRAALAANSRLTVEGSLSMLKAKIAAGEVLRDPTTGELVPGVAANLASDKSCKVLNL